MDKRFYSARTGNLEQIVYATKSVLTDGKADGMRVVNVDNGAGINCTLLEGRCLDIARLSYKGVNLSFLAKPGIVSPQHCSTLNGEYSYIFQAGMLYTCGLDNVGGSGVGEYCVLPTHGRIGLTPVSDVSTDVDWDSGLIIVTGKIKFAALFDSNIQVQRKITIPILGDEIIVEDTVENLGFKDEEIMLLYHCNFGWPMLCEKTRIEGDLKDTRPRDDQALKGIDNWNVFETPKDDYEEQVFYHKPVSSDDGLTHVKVINDDINIKVDIAFDKDQLPELVQWKSMASGDYALGIEPSTCYVSGRNSKENEEKLVKISAGEKKTYRISIKINECL